MRIEKDQKRAMLTAGIMLTVFTAALLVPLRFQRASYQHRIDDARQALGIDLADTKGLAKLNSEVAGLRQVINGAQQYVPDQDEMADVMRGLSEALDAFGVTERQVQTQTTQHYQKYSVMPITLQYRASFPSVFGVLRRIEQMQRLIRVDALEVRHDSDDDLQPLEIKLSLSTFIARQSPAED
ncbi:MAG: type 4a pilus biogenesis protein PilO [Phycisphaeraceae bacterium]|nr:type 4a pilus biogenesis protein PilO [Phycisphaeraceae bacterium]